MDLGFGDSGKGLAVDWLCSRAPAEGRSPGTGRAIAVRFSGGHQVGHTVCRHGARHVFSNFCSGSLAGVPGYFSPDTIVFPPAIAREAQALAALPGASSPVLFLDSRATVATPADIAWNRARERTLGHGSCGVGYGAAVERSRAGVSLRVKDLDYPWVFREKLVGVAAYYEVLSASRPDWEAVFREELSGLNDKSFLDACGEARAYYGKASWTELSARYDDIILEGNQGILLDEENGIYPHVTWGSCGSLRALELLERAERRIESVDIYYVTRCYQTRHGAGPMSSAKSVDLVNATGESNTANEWQGEFRVAELDPELLRYALESDAADSELLLSRFRRSGCEIRKNLLITCLDQRPSFSVPTLLADLGGRFDCVYGCRTPEASGVFEAI